LQSPLRGANRGDVTARSAADNHDIIFSQTSPPLRLLLRQTIRFMEGCPGLRVRIAALPGSQIGDFSSGGGWPQPWRWRDGSERAAADSRAMNSRTAAQARLKHAANAAASDWVTQAGRS
ncbi:MAG: hypothetical protein WAN72_05885, partial [Candidatus Acidiferrales bacterium]